MLGGSLDSSNVRREWHLRRRWAQLAAVQIHDLRHGAASLFFYVGTDLATVSHILGHADPSITAAIYAHPIPGADREAMERMDQLLQQALGES